VCRAQFAPGENRSLNREEDVAIRAETFQASTRTWGHHEIGLAGGESVRQKSRSKVTMEANESKLRSRLAFESIDVEVPNVEHF
jgi:hypothetical protein